MVLKKVYFLEQDGSSSGEDLSKIPVPGSAGIQDSGILIFGKIGFPQLRSRGSKTRI
jgi:hypothetical protein